jgi:hypothetical protein
MQFTKITSDITNGPNLQLQFCVEKQNVENKEVAQDKVHVFEITMAVNMKNAVF